MKLGVEHEIIYAAIGDSLTVGVGGGYSGGFVPCYSNLTQQKLNTQVIYKNMGLSGATTGNVLTLVSYQVDVRQVLQAAEIVTITAGGNDSTEAEKSFLIHRNKKIFRKALIYHTLNFRGDFFRFAVKYDFSIG